MYKANLIRLKYLHTTKFKFSYLSTILVQMNFIKEMLKTGRLNGVDRLSIVWGKRFFNHKNINIGLLCIYKTEVFNHCISIKNMLYFHLMSTLLLTYLYELTCHF